MKKSLFAIVSACLLTLSACGASLNSASNVNDGSIVNVQSSESGEPGDNSRTQEEKAYTITWQNFDGGILEIDENVKEGTMPHYDGVDPIRPNDDEYAYSWNGWTPEVSIVTSDQTYVATFFSTKLILTYEITYDLDGGTNDPSNPSSYVAGSTLAFANPSKNGYSF